MRAPHHCCKTVQRRPQQSWSARVPGAVLRTSHLWHGGVWSDRKSRDGDECHGPHRCPYCNAVPASGVGSCARCHRSEESTSQTTSQRIENTVRNGGK